MSTNYGSFSSTPTDQLDNVFKDALSGMEARNRRLFGAGAAEASSANDEDSSTTKAKSTTTTGEEHNVYGNKQASRSMPSVEEAIENGERLFGEAVTVIESGSAVQDEEREHLLQRGLLAIVEHFTSSEDAGRILDGLTTLQRLHLQLGMVSVEWKKSLENVLFTIRGKISNK